MQTRGSRSVLEKDGTGASFSRIGMLGKQDQVRLSERPLQREQFHGASQIQSVSAERVKKHKYSQALPEPPAPSRVG